MNAVKIDLPFNKEIIRTLRAGDSVLLSGKMLVFRDAGHKRLYESMLSGTPTFDLRGQTVYFMGPCPARAGEVIGSAGPTTSCRMDKYTPYFFDRGLIAQIGKGKRNEESIRAIVRNGGIYFAAIGGAGAIYQTCITAAKVLYYEDLGTEAVREITVKDFPVIVAVDSRGNSVYRD